MRILDKAHFNKNTFQANDYLTQISWKWKTIHFSLEWESDSWRMEPCVCFSWEPSQVFLSIVWLSVAWSIHILLFIVTWRMSKLCYLLSSVLYMLFVLKLKINVDLRRYLDFLHITSSVLEMKTSKSSKNLLIPVLTEITIGLPALINLYALSRSTHLSTKFWTVSIKKFWNGFGVSKLLDAF